MGTKARARRRVVGPKVSLQPRPHAYALTHAQSGPHAVALGPSGRALIGKSSFVGELAAGLGGAFVCLLVVSIVMFLRRRRSARAADPASDVRTLLYVDD